MKQFTHKLACATWIVAALISGTASAATLYVWQYSPNPMPPYDSWVTAATNIQDAVDAAADGDTVLVTGGVYATGGRAVEGTMTNRVVIDKAITVESFWGPAVTVIEGAPGPRGGTLDGIRCAYVGTNAVLSGFTLTNGFTQSSLYYADGTGGGAWCESSATLTNCVITGNSAGSRGGGVYQGTLNNCTLSENGGVYGGGAYFSTLHNCTLTNNTAHFGNDGYGTYGGDGGGAYGGTLYNCTLSGNSADSGGGGASGGTLYNCILSGNYAFSGGGADGGTLYNCTVTENTAYGYFGLGSGGGVSGGTLYNCIVYLNTADLSDTNYLDSKLNYSCTTPMPTNGVGNITNTPVFVDLAGGDLHLRYGSPGIDAGTNLNGLITTDLDGNPRPLDGNGDGVATFDMGAYEFDARSLIPSDWFTSHGLDPSDPQVVWGNPDGDAFNTFQEWLAGTDPTNALSFFHIEDISKHSPVTVSLESLTNRTYTLWSTPQLSPANWTPVPGEQAIPGNGSRLTLSDSTNAPQQFYRVEVKLP